MEGIQPQSRANSSENQGPGLSAITTALLVLATVFVCLRFASRWIIGKIYGWDDWVMVAALMVVFATGGINYASKLAPSCDFPGCRKTFRQNCQLRMHKDIHDGVRPYVCDWPGCGRTFSQPGNMKAHKRRHTGEKPFVCDICSKAFPVKGNLNSHKNTHLKEKLFVCEMPDCNGKKRFTQRGNLKHHQDKFHREFMELLVFRINQVPDWASAPTELRRWAEYLGPLYKNLNKGIKGRARGTAVTSTALLPHPPLSSPETLPMFDASNATHFQGLTNPVSYRVAVDSASSLPMSGSSIPYDQDSDSPASTTIDDEQTYSMTHPHVGQRHWL